MIAELAERILSRCVEQNGSLPTPCLIWQGNKVGPGYGKVKSNGKEYMTHRIICEAIYGPIPYGCYAIHACDTPSCCSPLHIRPGTPQENTADSFAKGRRKYKGSSSKLNQQLVGEIRGKLTAGNSVRAIAEEYRVSISAIKSIKYGYNWCSK